MIFSLFTFALFLPDWITNIARCACLDVLCRWNSIKGRTIQVCWYLQACVTTIPLRTLNSHFFSLPMLTFHVNFGSVDTKNARKFHLFHSAASSTREIVSSSVNLMPAHSGRDVHRGICFGSAHFTRIPASAYVQRIMTSRRRWIQFPSRCSRHSVGSSLVKQQKAISKIISAKIEWFGRKKVK